jgi:hypothetical protein
VRASFAGTRFEAHLQGYHQNAELRGMVLRVAISYCRREFATEPEP